MPPTRTNHDESGETASSRDPHWAERVRARRFFDRLPLAFALIERSVVPEYRDLVAQLNLPTHLTVLDLGTGTGAFANAFGARGHEVLGVDFSSKLLERARKLNPAARFEQRDILSLDHLSDDAFDMVTLGYVLHGLSRDLRMRALAVARRLARRHVLIVDHRQRTTWFLKLIEWAEGPHYFEYIKSPLSETLHRAGLVVMERGRTRSGGGYWLCGV